MNTTDKTILELTTEETEKYIDELYSCFPTGREFEVFLNSFLTALGFEEVVTTQYVGDKGIDLTCIKSGLDLNGTDTINYYVQAKRYARSTTVILLYYLGILGKILERAEAAEDKLSVSGLSL